MDAAKEPCVFCFVSCIDTFLGTVKGEQLDAADLGFKRFFLPIL